MPPQPVEQGCGMGAAALARHLVAPVRDDASLDQEAGELREPPARARASAEGTGPAEELRMAAGTCVVAKPLQHFAIDFRYRHGCKMQPDHKVPSGPAVLANGGLAVALGRQRVGEGFDELAASMMADGTEHCPVSIRYSRTRLAFHLERPFSLVRKFAGQAQARDAGSRQRRGCPAARDRFG